MSFPTTIDSFATPGATLASNPHSSLHTAETTALSAIENKLGVDSSAVTTSIDYKLKNPLSISPGHKHVTADITDAGTYISTGIISTYGGSTTVPSPFLQIDGSAQSRTAQAALFAVIGTGYGIGDGATTFNLPNQLATTQGLFCAKLVAASSMYLTAPDSASLSITGNITLSAWINFTSLPSAGNSMSLVTKRNNVGNQRSYALNMKNSTGNKFSFLVSVDGTAEVELLSSAMTINLGQWYHLAVSYVASTGIASFYQDGVLVNTASGGPAAIFNSTATFNIGAMDAGVDNYLDGYVANVKVMNTALSITAVGSNKYFFNQSNTQGSWTLSSVLTDNSGNTNTLTNPATATFQVFNVPDIAYVKMIKT